MSRASAARFLGAVLLSAIANACIAAGSADAARCAAIKNDGERLRCYDEAARREKPGAAGEPLRQLGAKPAPEGAIPSSALSERWELDPHTKQGVWIVRPHQPFFLLVARTTNNPNDSPQSPTHPVSQSVPLDNTEAEFQLSFKAKAWENILSSKADLWVGYTQQSQWQVYNSQISRPFRETNYQPEIFAVYPTDYKLLGMRGRFAGLGLVHQSNGRADPLSRSWNRVYAQLGFERGDFSLLVRPWYRLKEKPSNDDNPDINWYMGYGDLLGIYKRGGHEFSLLGRFNTNTHYGALQGTWSFPIHERLKGYVKAFTGYGETLIDYNWKQTTIGIGVLLADWL